MGLANLFRKKMATKESPIKKPPPRDSHGRFSKSKGLSSPQGKTPRSPTKPRGSEFVLSPRTAPPAGGSGAWNQAENIKIKKEKPTKKKGLGQTAPSIATFYGQNIRKFYVGGEWLFALEDFLPLANIFERDFLIKLKAKSAIKKQIDNLIKKVTYQEEKTSKAVECVSYAGFMKLLPHLRSPKYQFPGPLPDWLAEISTLPAAPSD